MKINEIIKERRTALNLTQEQVASYLGVTAPAVNKWEKGGVSINSSAFEKSPLLRA